MRSLAHKNPESLKSAEMSSILTNRKSVQSEHPTRNEEPFLKGSWERKGNIGEEKIPLGKASAFNFSRISILPTPLMPIQTKLAINTPGDRYEQEADRVAEKVMRMEDHSSSALGHHKISLQRKCAACEEEEEDQKLMRKGESGGGIVAGPSLVSQLNTSKGTGMPLPASTKGFMENSIGADLSKVRVHSDRKATEMSRRIHAKAFTHGTDIYFNQGEFKPHTSQGKRLLAHELVHTMQQASGLFRSTIQREGEEKKGGEKKEITTKVEVVTGHDFSEEKTKTKATTTRSAEEKVAEGVTATATEKTSDEIKSGTAEIKAKDKSSGLSVAGGIKAESPSDPTKADSAKGFIKVGGQWTLFDSNLKLESGLSTEFNFSKTPKVSADGKAVFLPNGVVSPEIAAGLVYDEKGVTGKVNPAINFRITENLSAKAGVPIEVGPDNKLKAGVGVGFVLKF